MARQFKPVNEAEMATLIADRETLGSDGNLELWKTTDTVAVITESNTKTFPEASKNNWPASSYTVTDLFRERWHVELDLRSIKVHTNMEDLRGKTPEIVRKELWAYWLAYNLISKTMAQAALLHERTVRTISFCGALQAVAGMMGQAATADLRLLTRLAKDKLKSIASRRVGHRPNRVEPRAIKRRPKSQKLLMQPRAEARAELLKSPDSAA